MNELSGQLFVGTVAAIAATLVWLGVTRLERAKRIDWRARSFVLGGVALVLVPFELLVAFAPGFTASPILSLFGMLIGWWFCWAPGGILGVTCAWFYRSLHQRRVRRLGCKEHLPVDYRENIPARPSDPGLSGASKDIIVVMTALGMPGLGIAIAFTIISVCLVCMWLGGLFPRI